MKNLKQLYDYNFISKKHFEAEDGTGKFKFKITISVIDLDEATSELTGYGIYVNAVKTLKHQTTETIQAIAKANSFEDIKSVTVFDVSEYGLCAQFDSFHITKEQLQNKLLEIDNMIPIYGGMCGFYFDKPLNRLGNTGWDFINGNIGFSNIQK